MLSSKSKSGLPDAVNNKHTPTGKFGRVGSIVVDTDSPSQQRKPSFSIDDSPRSAESKPMTNRRSPKNSTTPDKQSRLVKGSELQSQLTALQENLRTAKEQLALEEKEKARVLEELSDAKKVVEEANLKIAEALLAQKKAEENSELDKFRADELEQSSIEAAQKKEKEWSKKVEDIRHLHAVDVSALLSATNELQTAKQELMMMTDEKNTALRHAEDVKKIASFNAEKVEILSSEVNRLQSLLDSKLENQSKETAELIRKMGLEAVVLKLELENVKLTEEKLIEMKALIKGLKTELSDAKRYESDAVDLVDVLKKNIELLESRVEELNQSERLAHDSLVSLSKQVEESKFMLDDAESETISLKGKAEALEIEVAMHKFDHEKSCNQLDLVKQEVVELEKLVEVLKFEIQKGEEEKIQVLSKEKLTTLNLENISLENSNLAIELDSTKKDLEKAKKELEGFASVLHEVSLETRDIQERLLIKHVEVDSATAEAEELNSALKNTREKYEILLDEAKYEIICLKKAIDKYKADEKDSVAEWHVKELNQADAMKKADDGIASIKLERDKVVEELELKKYELKSAEEESTKLQYNLRQAESDLLAANVAIEEAKAESNSLKERLLDKENELQCIAQENDDLRLRDIAASEKVKLLSDSLAKVSLKEENGHTREGAEHDEKLELNNGDKNYSNLAKLIETMEDKFNETESGKLELLSEVHEVVKLGMNLEENSSESAEADPIKMKSKDSEGAAVDKQAIAEREHYTESIDDDFDAKIDVNALDQAKVDGALNGSTSPTKSQQLQKKKKALLHKFGNLLKKKNTPK